MKNKLDSIGHLAPSKSEWAGFYLENEKTVMLKPKSFESFSEEQLNAAFYGLFNILCQIKKEEKNIKILKDEVDLFNTRSESVLFYYLYIVLDEVYAELLTSNYFFFEKKTENASAIKGRIDFSRSVEKNFGLSHKMICKYNRISFRHPVLSLVREYFSYFGNLLHKINTLGDKVSEDLMTSTAHVNYLFSEADILDSYLDESLKLVSGAYDQDDRFFNIIENLKILGSFYLDNNLYFSQQSNLSNLKMHGLVFNLNRPFEYIIKKACESYLNISSKSYSEFTKIKYESTDKLFQMKPDIWLQYKNKTIILDVKHKIHSGDLDEEDIKKEKLDRNDLYQLISYMTTHPLKSFEGNNAHPEEANANIYGIVSLLEERVLNDYSCYVKREAVQALNVDTLKEKIIIVPVRLGSFLVDLGSAVSKNNFYYKETGLESLGDGLFYELGKQLNTIFKFKVDDEKSMVQEWVNSLTHNEEYFVECSSVLDILRVLNLKDYFVGKDSVEEFLKSLTFANSDWKIGTDKTEHFSRKLTKFKLISKAS